MRNWFQAYAFKCNLYRYIVGFRDDLASAAERFVWPEEPESCSGTVEDVLEDEAGDEYFFASGGGGGGDSASSNRNEAMVACEVSQYQMERSAAFFARRDEERGGAVQGASS
jgi:hypothetical protein